MSDYIKREDVKREAFDLDNNFVIDLCDVDLIPSADVAPVRHEEDGTLWVTVGDCEKVGRVIVKNEQGHFCRMFYIGDGDEEPVRHGQWIHERLPSTSGGSYEVIRCSECQWQFPIHETRYCPNCGARMDGE